MSTAADARDREPDQRDVIAFLSEPASYDGNIGSVERHETHGSLVFLAGDYVYKLKRAVRYPYLDYSTPALRRRMCEAELSVNRRLAPDLYLEVRPLVKIGNKIRFGSAHSERDAVDWVVVMRRFDRACLLESMRARDVLNSDIIRSLAETVATFHKSAEPRPAFGGAAGMSRVVEENIDILNSMRENPFDALAIESYASLSHDALHRVAELLEDRRRNGLVRRCHGDLHLNNVCLIGGKPVLFDAIEFSEEFASIDVLYDLSFLLMELEHHKLRPFANELLNRYLEQTGDYGGLAALPLFLSCRAAIRAHVTATLASKSGFNRDGLNRDATLLLSDAVAVLKPMNSILVAIGGVSGTGKSTVARRLAPFVGATPGAIVLRSDVVRKELFGAEETSHLPEDAYTEAASGRVYARLCELANLIVASGHAVIVDAVFGTEKQRAEIAAVATDAKVEFLGLWLEAPQRVLESRIMSRTRDASDATVEVLRGQLAVVHRPSNWRIVDASGVPDDVASVALSALKQTFRTAKSLS